MARLAVLAVLALALCSCAHAQMFGGATSIQDLMGSIISKSGLGLPKYASVGSSAGINGFISGKYAIGGSDNPLTPAQVSRAKAAKIVPGTLPLTLATYSVVNNKGGFNLKACDLAKIYRGQITSWSKIPGSKLTGTIVPLMRDTGSGTTEIFTTYLRKACPSVWPTSLTGAGPYNTGNKNLKFVKGSDGMGSAVAANDNAVGYVQTSFGVTKYKNKEVAIQNKAGKYITAGASDPYQSIPRALPGTFSSWSGVTLDYKAGAKTFPMVSFAYLLAKKSYKGTSYGKKVVSFLKFAMSSKGQVLASAAFFSPLPSKVIATNDKGIMMIST